MPRQRTACFLVLLAAWSHFDDALLAPCPLIPSSQLSDDDDEYLSVAREPAGSRSSEAPVPVPHGLTPLTAGSLPIPRAGDARPGSRLTGLFVRSPLYALMSLQL
jgi:hypothetical protein